MDIQAHFSDIQAAILACLGTAERDIVVAVAWFTDQDLFDLLCKKAAFGVGISMALVGDDINRGRGRLNFRRLEDLGGRVCFIPPGTQDESLMHHKFCVVDGQTVITGSFNWSRKARANDENIAIITQAPELAQQYLAAFAALLDRQQPGARPAADATAARRRLELIRNLILLEEYREIGGHLDKLRPVARELHWNAIVAALDQGDFTGALEQMAAVLQRSTALAPVGAVEIGRLKLQLQGLELRLEALSAERAELERRLVLFNHRHDAALGDLIQRVLKARAGLARWRADCREAGATDEDTGQSQAEAAQADARYREYREQQAALREAPPPPVLSAAAERELKQLYRRACHLCHPDKVAEAHQGTAQAAFVRLQEAFRRNDLDAVRAMYQTLKMGGPLGIRSSLLDEVEALKAALAHLEHQITRLVRHLAALRAGPAVALMEEAARSEADWEAFVAACRNALEEELADIEQQISGYCQEEI